MADSAPPSYQFGSFRLDSAARVLWHGEREVPLRRKVFDCLVHLVEHRERVVGRDELIEAVWKTLHLSDSVLGRAIFEMRRALDDDGEEPRYVRTVRGVGYRWVAPVEVVVGESLSAPRPRRGGWRLPVLGLLLVLILIGGTFHAWRSMQPGSSESAPHSPVQGEIALLLPVAVEGDDRHPWIRLGVMDLIATRLRAAGQPMVPSDGVIALLSDPSDMSDPAWAEALMSRAGAHRVFEARAEPVNEGWRVTLVSLRGSRPLLTASGEAGDVLEAARIAADRMSLSLGLTPPPPPDAEPGLALLLQQTEAAMLAQQMSLARELIESADPALRRDPRLRLQAARIEADSHELDAAQAGFESLLELPVGELAPLLRARVLYELSMIHFRRGDLNAARPVVQQAADLLAADPRGEILVDRGRIGVRLGTVIALSENMEAARPHLVQARLDLESTADLIGLAGLDNNLAGLEARQGRYVEALGYLERAARRFGTLNDVGGELRARFNLIWSHLNLLEPLDALAVLPRLEELVAQTTDPALIANARLAQAALYAASGRSTDAERLLADTLSIIETRPDLHELRVSALVMQADRAARRDDMEEAARSADQALAQVPAQYPVLEIHLARARLIRVRALLAQGRGQEAAEAAEALGRWAEHAGASLVVGEPVLAAAEVAAAAGHPEQARALFEHALHLAEHSRVPANLLRVCEAYVAWLLEDTPHKPADPEHALLVASRLDGYADRYYDAALLQLRAYHAAGVPSAWRGALARARSLAGEREVPAALQLPPES